MVSSRNRSYKHMAFSQANMTEIFGSYPNSLIYETLLPNDLTEEECNEIQCIRELPKETTLSLSNVSSYYLYTGTPPHGYGTQAPKVAETVSRSYQFNRKKENKEQVLDGYKIERMHWEKADGVFPQQEVHGNFIPSQLKEMCKNYLSQHQKVIDETAQSVMEDLMNSNADVLTSGRQTFCPFTEQSVTAATAFKRAYDFLSANTQEVGMSCLDWIRAIMTCFEKEQIVYNTVEIRWTRKRKYKKELKQHLQIDTPKAIRTTKATGSKKETRKVMIELTRKFASYLKHKERGKKERRAICSQGMLMRMFLRIIEEFHLKLAVSVPGSTISIGGEEKKMKITNTFSTRSLNNAPAPAVTQGTEDATKWNECLAPGAFALMHTYLFDNDLRRQAGVSQATQWGRLFSRIAVVANFLMALKQIQLGPGVQVKNEREYSRIQWIDDHVHMMSNHTREWYLNIREHKSEDNKYLNASPGMLMGMLNAGSTTLGLLAENHRMNNSEERVVTLRSSDDSMTLYLASNEGLLKSCISKNILNLGMLGINMSPDKSFFFDESYGEYTSWYMDGKFVSQYGVETSSLRPQGKNPYDDAFAIAKGTATALTTLNINPLGASARLRIGIDNVRRLWRIERNPDKRHGIKDTVLSLCDGGISLWTPMNCHIDDMSLRKRNVTEQREHEYLLKLLNPDNPFVENNDEEMTYSKEHGTDRKP